MTGPAAARPDQRSYYDPHVLRYTAGTIAGVTTAVVTGTLGVRAWRRKPIAVVIVPTDGGAAMMWAGRFP